ncbi:hypothetical protein ACTIVE_3311 [Actinomadura verrucosospora]|uniref:Uncharacterized protein n=1 Tax=Actinomadura verrucosospora TaxID=46165 RepID=A0A7D3VST6_ACTVE|nr:hypothetical protein ACTIVE_3311 [Actinomadura verrucosospora]
MRGLGARGGLRGLLVAVLRYVVGGGTLRVRGGFFGVCGERRRAGGGRLRRVPGRCVPLLVMGLVAGQRRLARRLRARRVAVRSARRSGLRTILAEIVRGARRAVFLTFFPAAHKPPVIIALPTIPEGIHAMGRPMHILGFPLSGRFTGPPG